MGIFITGEVKWIAFSSSGTRLAILDGTSVSVYDYPQGNVVFKLTKQRSLVCSYSPDGRLLACVDYKEAEGFFNKIELQYIQIWDITTNKQICCVEFPHDHETVTLCCLKFSPNSTQLAIVREDGLVSVIRVATGQAVHLESPSKRFYVSSPSCIFFPESDALVYTYLDEAIKIADLNAGRTVLSLKLNTQLSAPECVELIGFRPSDQKLLVAFYGKDDYDNRIDVLDPRNGALTPFIRGSRGYKWSPSHTTLSPRGNYFAASVFKEVRSFLLTQPLHAVTVWDAYTGRVVSETTTDTLTSRGLFSSVFSLAFDPNGNLLIGRKNSIEQITIH